ncbi:unnamed protein product [Ambrosiozyma monospora]|uniref:Unnamed protein product n=2 Tax=Ambrosiozyma monospora TaxID=43982 RepID=A0ACB5U1H5_AMBMO|nr:unnamed protein product [Ambrosiozyma monospora]
MTEQQRDFKLQDLTKRSTHIFQPQDQHLRTMLVPFTAINPTPASPKTEKHQRDTMFQVVGLQDITKSGIQYIELLMELLDSNDGFADRQRGAGGQGTRGGRANGRANGGGTRQRVITSVDVNDDGDGQGVNQQTNGFFVGGRRNFKLTLQDAFGNLCYAFEREELNFLRNGETGGQLYPVKMGSKLLVRSGAELVYNSFWLRNTDVVFLGGEVEKMNYRLYERELQRIKDSIGYRF